MQERQYTNGPYGGQINAIAFIGTNTFVATGGVFRTTNDGSNGSAANNGLPTTNVHALTIKGSILFAGVYLAWIIHKYFFQAQNQVKRKNSLINRAVS